jgi:preprotein translocase subunit YajC
MVGSSWFASFFLLGEAAPEGDLMQMIGPMLPFLVIGVLFWVLMIRPESKKTADLNKMREGLKKNDRILTIGGIFGTVVNVQKDAKDITIRVDDNTRIRVLRSSIALVLGEGEEGDAAKTTEPQ